jgi:hypothetical protein
MQRILTANPLMAGDNTTQLIMCIPKPFRYDEMADKPGYASRTCES